MWETGRNEPIILPGEVVTGQWAMMNAGNKVNANDAGVHSSLHSPLTIHKSTNKKCNDNINRRPKGPRF